MNSSGRTCRITLRLTVENGVWCRKGAWAFNRHSTPKHKLSGESGHGDIRMLVPSKSVRDLANQVTIAGLIIPVIGDFALLEWPTQANPIFRLTFLEQGSQLFLSVEALFNSAAAVNQLVGRGACWLPAGVSPP